MEILFLDDSPRRRLEFAKRFANSPEGQGSHLLLVETYNQAVNALMSHPVRFDQVWLDRDLNDYEPQSYAIGLMGADNVELTGEDVADFIVHLPEDRRPLEVFVHSWNPDGGQWMVKACAKAGIKSAYRPFGNPTCGTCKKPIAEHTGDGRRDGTGYICPQEQTGPHPECEKMHAAGYCACGMVSCCFCNGDRAHPAHKPHKKG